MLQVLAFSFSLGTLKFSIQNFLKTQVLLKIFDTEFANKHSLIYSQPFCMCNTICLYRKRYPNTGANLDFYLDKSLLNVL